MSVQTKRVDQEKLHGLDIDETQMTQQDVEFVAFTQRAAILNIFGGATIGFGVPFLASTMTRAAAQHSTATIQTDRQPLTSPVRNRGGSRLLRGATIAMGTVVGMMLGTVRTTQVITKRVDTLSNDSYIKKLANSVLVDRYPMAVADTMEERRQTREGK